MIRVTWRALAGPLNCIPGTNPVEQLVCSEGEALVRRGRTTPARDPDMRPQRRVPADFRVTGSARLYTSRFAEDGASVRTAACGLPRPTLAYAPRSIRRRHDSSFHVKPISGRSLSKMGRLTSRPQLPEEPVLTQCPVRRRRPPRLQVVPERQVSNVLARSGWAISRCDRHVGATVGPSRSYRRESPMPVPNLFRHGHARQLRPRGCSSRLWCESGPGS
jgi:hypothetical protein